MACAPINAFPELKFTSTTNNFLSKPERLPIHVTIVSAMVSGEKGMNPCQSSKKKALKTLVWHLSRELMNEMSSLKIKQTVMYDEQIQTN